MKTIATTIMAQTTPALTASDIIYALLPYLVLLLIGIVFSVDLYKYLKLLEARMQLDFSLSLMEGLTHLEKVITDKVSEDNQQTIKELREMLNYVNYKIENYKGLSRPILGLFGVK